ncbi:MAG: proton-conducting transporter membrane subunit, partial [Gammaproteobacteria bacterium]|nr:proton-conducting transporter membrane subunit [Gammaproteobacteria bacterium]
LWMGLNALFLASDAFNLYVTLEVVSLSGVALTALGGDRAALAAALRYLFAGMLASLLYLLGVALLYIEHGTLSLTALGAALGASRAGPLATALILTGLLFKGALFPLHFWLPTAHANAPAPVSALLSALVVKAALYLLLRWWLEVWGPGLSWGVAQLIGTLGALAVLWGSTQALLAPRLKLVVAYSTVAQMGYLLLIFPLAHDATAMALVWSGVVYFAISHGLAKAAMFLAAGNAMRLHGHDNIAGLAGLGAHMPVSAFAMALAGISLIGLPFSGGFVGKWLMLNAALAAGQWWWLMLLALGSLLAAAYVFRVLRLIFVTPEHTPAGRLPGALEWPALLLALAAIVLGFTFTALAPLIDIGAPGAALGLRP